MSEREDGLAAAGVRLRSWREGQGLSQSAAADRIRASQTTWAAWERGEKGPDLHFAFEIERLTDGESPVLASDWAFPRKGSKAATESGEHPAIVIPSDTGTEA